MNKTSRALGYLLGLSCLFSSHPINGGVPERKLTSILFIKGHSEQKLGFEVQIFNDEVRVNGSRLSSTEVLLKHKSIKAAFMVEKTSIPLICTAGVYIHTVQLADQKPEIEEGCITDPRFDVLYLSHANLRRFM